ncbi:MAG: preprotein translocase subunit SecA [Clostridia bacterium]|nr:preprotein translocase subunit SecA [Clostridia bacterium]
MGLFEKIFGSYSDRAIKQIKPIVEEINKLEPEMKAKSDAELRDMTGVLKGRLAAGETLDEILPTAFAVVREAAVRVLGQRHYDVQMIGGIVLHQGRIAEMKTGEGKTLVSTLPTYLNALEGKGVHVVTVNDYLAKRDSEWMGKVFRFLGLSVGVILHDMKPAERKAAYACDITYATNNELGFDYLRDNMVRYKENLVQRDLHFAVVDEVDSILIDEARTPLIISGAGEKSSELYERADKFAESLTVKVIKEADKKDLLEDVEEDYIVDEKARSASLTQHGVDKAEKWFGIENLADSANAELMHHINQAIKARGVMKRDIDYVVKDGSVIIVDEFTGRLMFGRRYNEGLHQAIEAKERVKVEKESMTQATITFQNFFRMYKKISGMTGTALTEEAEFQDIYGLDVVVIPTNRPVMRHDYPDSVYRTVKGKYEAIIRDTIEANAKGQPVLIGTVSIEKSEHLSKLLGRRGIKHNVLNAKNHEREAEIVAQAGKFGAVTIATNMAGRGTDIMLGGNAEFMAKQELRRQGFTEDLIRAADSFADTDDETILTARKLYRELMDGYNKEILAEREKVKEAGGLFIMGTERHESRRIDNQLRGRSGRQGDPGMSRFYISLEDDLMRLFGSERIETIASALKLEEDMPIEHKFLSNAIEGAQKRVEAKNFEIRKNVLQYDDVMNQQREVIYSQRKRVLDGENLSEFFKNLIKSRVEECVSEVCHKDIPKSEWYLENIKNEIGYMLPEAEFQAVCDNRETFTAADITEKLSAAAIEAYETKENTYGSEIMRELERISLLYAVDKNWMEHIDTIDQLRHTISLRSIGQKDPVVEYKFEAFEMFDEMNTTIQKEALRLIFMAQVRNGEQLERRNVAVSSKAGMASNAQAAAPSAMANAKALRGESQGPERGQNNNSTATFKRDSAKVGRNDKCPCGSGKKYKNCCGINDED